MYMMRQISLCPLIYMVVVFDVNKATGLIYTFSQFTSVFYLFFCNNSDFQTASDYSPVSLRAAYKDTGRGKNFIYCSSLC